MNVKQGNFTEPLASGSQSITGVGFKPGLVFFYWGDNSQSTGFTSTDCGGSFGWAIDSSNRFVSSYFDTQNSNFEFSVSVLASSACIYRSDVLSRFVKADITSMDSDGFTLNWSNNTDSFVANHVNYLALGGDITNIKSSTFTTSNVASQSITGVGFKPDLLMLITNIGTSALDYTDSANSYLGIGMGTSSSHRGFSGRAGCTGTATVSQLEATNAILVGWDPSNDLISYKGDLASLDSDGFTLSWSTRPSTGYIIPYLAIKGGKYFVGNETQKTSTGTKATTGVGFSPQGLVFFSGDATASSSLNTSISHTTMGATDGTNQSNQTLYNDGTLLSQYWNNTLSLGMITGVSTLNAAAAISSFDSGGFTLNWTTADTTAREFLFLAIGNAGVLNLSTITPTVATTVSLPKEVFHFISGVTTSVVKKLLNINHNINITSISIPSFDTPLIKKMLSIVSPTIISFQPKTNAITHLILTIIEPTSLIVNNFISKFITDYILGWGEMWGGGWGSSSIVTSLLKTPLKTFSISDTTTTTFRKPLVNKILQPIITTSVSIQNYISTHISVVEPISVVQVKAIFRGAFSIISTSITSFIKQPEKPLSASSSTTASIRKTVEPIENIASVTNLTIQNFISKFVTSPIVTILSPQKEIFKAFSLSSNTVVTQLRTKFAKVSQINLTVATAPTVLKTVDKITQVTGGTPVLQIKTTLKILSPTLTTLASRLMEAIRSLSISKPVVLTVLKTDVKAFQFSSLSSTLLTKVVGKPLGIQLITNLSMVKEKINTLSISSATVTKIIKTPIKSFTTALTTATSFLAGAGGNIIKNIVVGVTTTTSLSNRISYHINQIQSTIVNPIKGIQKTLRATAGSSIAFSKSRALFIAIIPVHTTTTTVQTDTITTAINFAYKLTGFVFNPNDVKISIKSVFRSITGTDKIG